MAFVGWMARLLSNCPDRPAVDRFAPKAASVASCLPVNNRPTTVEEFVPQPVRVIDHVERRTAPVRLAKGRAESRTKDAPCPIHLVRPDILPTVEQPIDAACGEHAPRQLGALLEAASPGKEWRRIESRFRRDGSNDVHRAVHLHEVVQRFIFNSQEVGLVEELYAA